MEIELLKGIVLEIGKELVVHVDKAFHGSLKPFIATGNVTAILTFNMVNGTATGQQLAIWVNDKQIGSVDYGGGGSGQKVQPIDLTPSLVNGDNKITITGYVCGNLLKSTANVIIFAANNVGTPLFQKDYQTDDFVSQINDTFPISYSK